jgi:hypothetical protein
MGNGDFQFPIYGLSNTGCPTSSCTACVTIDVSQAIPFKVYSGLNTVVSVLPNGSNMTLSVGNNQFVVDELSDYPSSVVTAGDYPAKVSYVINSEVPDSSPLRSLSVIQKGQETYLGSTGTCLIRSDTSRKAVINTDVLSGYVTTSDQSTCGESMDGFLLDPASNVHPHMIGTGTDISILGNHATFTGSVARIARVTLAATVVTAINTVPATIVSVSPISSGTQVTIQSADDGFSALICYPPGGNSSEPFIMKAVASMETTINLPIRCAQICLGVGNTECKDLSVTLLRMVSDQAHALSTEGLNHHQKGWHIFLTVFFFWNVVGLFLSWSYNTLNKPKTLAWYRGVMWSPITCFLSWLRWVAMHMANGLNAAASCCQRRHEMTYYGLWNKKKPDRST